MRGGRFRVFGLGVRSEALRMRMHILVRTGLGVSGLGFSHSGFGLRVYTPALKRLHVVAHPPPSKPACPRFALNLGFGV